MAAILDSDPQISLGLGRWLCALSVGLASQVFHKAGDWGLGTGEESDPLACPPSLLRNEGALILI